MRINDLISISIKNSIRNLRNTSLSVSAIAIGISSVILISGVGNSVKTYAQDTIDDLGIDGLSLWSTDTDSILDPEISNELEASVTGVEYCVPFVYNIASSVLCKKTNQVISWGVGENLSKAIGMDLLYGRDINSQDISANKRVAIVDEQLAKDNYKRSNIVGKTIRLYINGKSDIFEVIGVIQSQSQGLSSIIEDIDRFVYIPYSVQNEMNCKSGVDQIAIKCQENINTDDVCEYVLEYMKTNHPINGDYNIENISSYLSRVKDIMKGMIILVTVIGGISLVVAGIGVINGMISGVAQRRREIGLYMSVGALSFDIVCDIIIETVIICFIGELIGLIFGISTTFIAVRLIGVKYCPNIKYIVFSVATSVVFSVLFGVIPAMKAAKTEPVDVLRILD